MAMANGLVEVEPILSENSQRFTMFPIKYNAVWEFYKKAEASFWTGKYGRHLGFTHILFLNA